MSRVPTLAWLLTIAEVVFGFWLGRAGYPMTGGAIIGAAVALQIARVCGGVHWPSR